jgi:hypothetical protein
MSNGTCCTACCRFWKPRQYPVFDYDEIDDLEFENLLSTPGPAGPFAPPQPPSIWTNIASLFGFHRGSPRSPGYTAVPTYDTLRRIGDTGDVLDGQENMEDAEMLTQERISEITTPYKAQKVLVCLEDDNNCLSAKDGKYIQCFGS